MTAICQRRIVGDCSECGIPMHTIPSQHRDTPCGEDHGRHAGQGLCRRCRHPLKTGICPTCQQARVLRADGTPVRHWAKRGKNTRIRCPAGESAGPQRSGQRVQVKVRIDAVIPADMNLRQYKQHLGQLLREDAAALLVVATEVELDLDRGAAS